MQSLAGLNFGEVRVQKLARSFAPKCMKLPRGNCSANLQDDIGTECRPRERPGAAALSLQLFPGDWARKRVGGPMAVVGHHFLVILEGVLRIA